MELVFPEALLLFDPEGNGKRESRVTTEARVQAKQDQRILCANCGNPITHRDERIEASGSHTHTCSNPHGFVFLIGCFRAAPGCRCEAFATAEHSWFSGYRWSIAYCAQCDRHLGWRFSASADEFHGLILDRLTEAGE